MKQRLSETIRTTSSKVYTASAVGGRVVSTSRRDFAARVRHGRGAPRQFERIWIRPRDVERVGPRDGYRSGEVRDGSWDLDGPSFDELPKVIACRAHWIEGVPWDETGIYDFVLAGIQRSGRPEAGCWTRDDLVDRYRALDATFAAVARARRLKTRRELIGRFPRTFREKGGINIHVDRMCTPMFANGGTHRLVMAQVLELGVIPAAIGLVHAQALPAWRGPVPDDSEIRDE